MTLLFHVDESIQKNLYHVHLGVLATGIAIAEFEKRLDSLKLEARAVGAAMGLLEFHGYDMLQRKGPWKSVAPRDAIDLVRRTLQLIGELDIEVIIRCADLPSVRSKRGPDCDVYKWMFSNLLERLNERLSIHDEFGLVIADEQHEYGSQLKQLVRKWKSEGTAGYRAQVLDRVLDTVHFVDSNLSPMTQLADMAAYVWGRRLAVPTEGDSRAEAAMKELYGLVWEGIPRPAGTYATVWSG